MVGVHEAVDYPRKRRGNQEESKPVKFSFITFAAIKQHA